MPNANVLNEKKKVVEELTEKLKSQSGVFVNYTGIKVNEDTDMRVKMREANIDYSVIKNTLMRFAIKNVGFEALEPILVGTTSLAISKDDPVAPARIVKEFADKFENYFEIKGGFMDGKVLSVDEVNSLASIPPLPILYAQLLGTMLAPIASLAVVLKAVADRDGAAADADEGAVEAAAAQAPAEEPAAESPVEEAAAEAPAEEPAAESPVEEAVAEAPAEEAAAEAPAKEATAEAPAEEAVAEAPAKEAAAEAPAEE